MEVKVKPLGDRVLIQPLEEKEVKEGGIIIPDTAKEKPQEGLVVAVGTGSSTTAARRSNSTSKSAIKSSSLSTAVPKLRSTVRTTSSCARTMSSQSLDNPEL
jgi:hypothetical protein